MTDREKAIVTAYTGITMLAGDKFPIFHKYIEDIMGRPIWTHELANPDVWDEIKRKSENDFLGLCKDESDDRWISVKERMPEPRVAVMIYCPSRKNQFCAYYDYELWHIFGGYSTIREEITHWKPLSQNPEESEGEE